MRCSNGHLLEDRVICRERNLELSVQSLSPTHVLAPIHIFVTLFGDILEETFDWGICEKTEYLILDSHETPTHHGDYDIHSRSYACENIYPTNVC